jgi:crotonobetainyl-CoA:carnitine CoA-transferase CaiB-like acyl-CoA transferase
MKSRSQNRKALNAEIDTYTAKKSSAEWIEIFNKAGVPAGPIYSIDQVFADPQVKHLGIAQDVAKRDGNMLTVVGQPIVASRTPSSIAAPPPELGQHTDDVLIEFGFDASEVAKLREASSLTRNWR